MATYANLELDHFYLIRETEGGEITLVQVVLETAKSFLLLHIDEIETTAWKKKDDFVFEIVEELPQEQVAEYEDLFEDDDDDWNFNEIEYDEDELDEDEEDEEEEEETIN
jgi:DNA-directed RNA polymerase delta subunit